MGDLVVIEPYNIEWNDEFTEKGTALRKALGDVATRIDHIGSTSIMGLDAKPIIDILISVSSFNQFEKIKVAIESCGYVHRADNPELSKRYFRELPGQKRTHVHVRIDGHISQQFPLLFRDYLRVHDHDAARYAKLKYALAKEHKTDRIAYTDGKTDFVWNIMRKAFEWSSKTGWIVGHSDV